nr:6,7-dimethyl-8-ribityllumazine synthase [bacterium]
MPKLIEGNLSAKGLKLAIVVSRFNDFITARLIEGAMDVISRSGGDAAGTTLVKVPGSFELALAAKKLAESGSCDAVICLGSVIR